MTVSLKVNPSRDKELHHALNDAGFLSGFDRDYLLHKFTFFKISLADAGLPPLEVLRACTMSLLDAIPDLGWSSNGVRHPDYTGVSLTYNPDFVDESTSVFHQTMGAKTLSQSYSKGSGKVKGPLVNSYYDSLAFRQVHPLVYRHMAPLFNCIRPAVSRSRVGILHPHLYKPDANKGANWHVDETPTDLLRINIPLVTSPEHVLQISGMDDYGTVLNHEEHLEPGYCYIWNTRVPHRIHTPLTVGDPRIHLVLGLLPYLDYNKETDTFTSNPYHGLPLADYVSQRRWATTS